MVLFVEDMADNKAVFTLATSAEIVKDTTVGIWIANLLIAETTD